MAEKQATLLLKIKEMGAKSLTSVRDKLKLIGTAAIAAGVAVVAFAAKSLMAYKEQEHAVNSLNQSLANQGIFTKELSKSYQDMAAALQKTSTFGDEAIIQSQAQLQSYLGQNKITKELMQSTLDFASAMGLDLKDAASLVGKTIGSSTNALSRYGVTLDAAASPSEKLAQVTEKLGDMFGGQASAAAAELGVLDQFKNVFGDLLEVIGKRVAPVFIFFINKLKNVAENAQSASGALDVFTSAINFVGKTAIGVAGVFDALGKTIGNVLGGSIGAMTMALKGDFSGAWQLAKEAAKSSVNDIVSSAGNLANNLKQYEAETTTSLETQNQKKLDNLLAFSERRKEIIAKQKESDKESLIDFNTSISEIQAQSDLELEQLSLENQKRLLDEKIQNEKNYAKSLDLERKRRTLKEKQEDLDKRKRYSALSKFKKWVDDNDVRSKQETFARIASLSQSNNQVLVTIGKAAALANIAISTAEGVAKALGAFPPPFNFAAAAAVGAAGAAQAAKVMGVALAEGGIVRATPGGVHTIIGEGGKDEAVIPLGDDRASGIGQTIINLTVNGGLLGDEDTARQLAVAIDENLYKLRKSNESIAFDEGLI